MAALPAAVDFSITQPRAMNHQSIRDAIHCAQSIFTTAEGPVCNHKEIYDIETLAVGHGACGGEGTVG